MRAKNKIFNFLLQKNVLLVKVMDLNQGLIQTDVLTVEEMEEYVQTKVFLRFNKRAHNVLVVERR